LTGAASLRAGAEFRKDEGMKVGGYQPKGNVDAHPANPYDELPESTKSQAEVVMSIDKSLRRKNTLARARSVLTRGERIKVLRDEDRWQEGRGPFGLPKVRVHKIVIKKAKKAKEEAKPEGAEGAAAAGAAPPAEAGKKPEAAKSAAKPAAKKEEKKK
jgi:small basic protein (TIGR04137 family)